MLQKNAIKDLILKVAPKWKTYAPLEDEWGETQFARRNGGRVAEAVDNLKLDYEKLVVPPKNIGFPQLESLFEFKGGKIKPTVQTSSPKLLFGLRACDLKGMLFVDDFFRRNFEDIYYLNRTQGRLAVVVGCTSPSPSCFCTSTGTGPFLRDGFDLQLVDLGDAYLVEIGSEAGEKFVTEQRGFFGAASKGAGERSKEVKRGANEAVTLRVDFEGALRRFREDRVPEGIYGEIAERCIYCGGCLYSCPTCTCFNVFDDVEKGKGARFRNWDGCVFEGYTREASGHNPRRERALRTARRYEHKLKYDYLATGLSGCVGCGRCLDSCPVGIGISQVIEEITESGG